MKLLSLKYFLLIPLYVLILVTALQPQRLLGQAAASAPPIDVARPIVRNITLSQQLPAFVEAINRVELHAQVNGYLDTIEYKAGQIVKKGDLLFRIDPRVFEARFADADAALAIAKSEADLANSEADRALRLHNRDAIAAEEVERRKAHALIAGSRVAAAEALLRSASLELQFTGIRAPIDGRIGRALITPGNLVTSSDVLAVIVSLDELYVRLDLAEQDFMQLSQYPREHWAVQFATDANNQQLYDGLVTIVDNEVRQGTGSVRIHARVDNPEHLLLPGMFGQAELIFGSKSNAILINEKSVATSKSQRFVLVINENNQVESRVIASSRKFGDLLLIDSGISAQDRIVLNSSARVYPGDLVVPVAVTMDAGTAPLPSLFAINFN
jgi:RND family efflux transporter MFP subunit